MRRRDGARHSVDELQLAAAALLVESGADGRPRPTSDERAAHPRSVRAGASGVAEGGGRPPDRRRPWPRTARSDAVARVRGSDPRPVRRGRDGSELVEDAVGRRLFRRGTSRPGSQPDAPDIGPSLCQPDRDSGTARKRAMARHGVAPQGLTRRQWDAGGPGPRAPARNGPDQRSPDRSEAGTPRCRVRNGGEAHAVQSVTEVCIQVQIHRLRGSVSGPDCFYEGENMLVTSPRRVYRLRRLRARMPDRGDQAGYRSRWPRRNGWSLTGSIRRLGRTSRARRTRFRTPYEMEGRFGQARSVFQREPGSG